MADLTDVAERKEVAELVNSSRGLLTGNGNAKLLNKLQKGE